MVERFTRVDAGTFCYQFTVEDPSRWRSPRSEELPLRRMEEYFFEYACHESNFSIANLFSGARPEEGMVAGSKRASC